jgi:hypothetical protein
MAIENLRIIFVPGKNPKPRPEEHQAQLWRCLVHGVDRADPELTGVLEQHPEVFQLASWNYLYYHHYKSLDRDLPWIEHLLTRSGASKDEREQLHSWRMRLGRLMYWSADLMPFLINFAPDPAIKATIAETRRYFENTKNIASRIREVLKDQIKAAWLENRKILLIGHSMGSIISYDSLWELGREEGYQGKIDMFLTIGCPLGMRFVQHRLVDARVNEEIRYPNNIRQWLNIASMGDLTALDPYLAGDYEDMVNRGLTESIRDEHRDVYNYFVSTKGLNVHRSYGYLVNEKVGAAIAAWIKSI